ncbi:MAG: DUF6455 family protein [Pseudomonadota bacterium]
MANAFAKDTSTAGDAANVFTRAMDVVSAWRDAQKRAVVADLVVQFCGPCENIGKCRDCLAADGADGDTPDFCRDPASYARLQTEIAKAEGRR